MVKFREYVVIKQGFGGSRATETFTSKRAAQSEAWRWLNESKRAIRERNLDRDYGQLHVEILMWDSRKETSTCIKFYD